MSHLKKSDSTGHLLKSITLRHLVNLCDNSSSSSSQSNSSESSESSSHSSSSMSSSSTELINYVYRICYESSSWSTDSTSESSQSLSSLSESSLSESTLSETSESSPSSGGYSSDSSQSLSSQSESSESSSSSEAYSSSSSSYIDSLWKRLPPKYPVANDEFGWAVDISRDGLWAIASSRGYATETGSVTIFKRSDTGGINVWDSGTVLAPTGLETSDYFGWSVSISADGEFCVVGCPGDDNYGGSSGACFAFQRTGTGNTWDSGVKIYANNPSAGDTFGEHVDISEDGNWIIAGATNEDTTVSNSGAAYIYERQTGNTWDSGVMVKAPTPTGSSYFGLAVSIDGDYAYVGSYGTESLFVFRRTDLGNSSSSASSQSSDSSSSSKSSSSISQSFSTDSSESTVAESTSSESSEPSLNNWEYMTELVSSDPEAGARFGWSCASTISDGDHYVVVGAYLQTGDYGAAYVYHLDGTWSAGVKLVGAADNGDFGEDVDICDTRIIVGHEKAVESVYKFNRTGANTWDSGVSLKPDPLIDPIELNVGFAISVAISDDPYLMAGAFTDDESASNGGGIWFYYDEDDTSL